MSHKKTSIAWIQSSLEPVCGMGRGRYGARPAQFEKKSQLVPRRDGGDMRSNMEEPIRDVMQEDQQPTE